MNHKEPKQETDRLHPEQENIEFSHQPVMLRECIAFLRIRAEGIYIDGTLGGGGHASAILQALGPAGRLIGIDQDDAALHAAEVKLAAAPACGIYTLHKANFADIQRVCKDCGISGVDGILMDLGVSSYQFDTAERGFSYRLDAPLDMRMDRSNPLDAKIVVNQYAEPDLIRIIRAYGEESCAVQIGRSIVRAREKKPIETTLELADIIKAGMPSRAKHGGGHPAKRTFQAIRIEVNHELEVLKQALADGIGLLRPGGRFCVITFHSLEDRIVKNMFREAADPCTCPADFPVCVCGRAPAGRLVTPRPITAAAEELAENRRARSAKLRVFEKNEK